MITNVVLLYYINQSLSMVLLSFLFPILGEEKKLTEIFIFTLLFGARKCFMKVLKAFIKPFEAPKRILMKI